LDIAIFDYNIPCSNGDNQGIRIIPTDSVGADRGAALTMWGNEFTVFGLEGSIIMAAGDVANGNIAFQTADDTRVLIVNDGGVYMDNLETGVAETANVCMFSSTGELLEETDDVCTVSGRRFKTDIETLDYGIKEVMKLNPRFFRYKLEYDPDDQNRKIGFIAEEVAEVIPEVVSYQPDGQTDSVDYKVMVSLLTKAMQEQQALIDNLLRRITILEGR